MVPKCGNALRHGDSVQVYTMRDLPLQIIVAEDDGLLVLGPVFG